MLSTELTINSLIGPFDDNNDDPMTAFYCLQ